MSYDRELPMRKSFRLKGYDYTKQGLYFITICVQNMECLFGRIENEEMILNQLGAIANEYWMEIPKHYPQVKLHEHIIMPNHMHGIIELAPGHSAPPPQFAKPIPGSVSMIINQYKSSVKRWCNKNGHEYFLWKPRFFDHIIRCADDYQKTSKYIIDNPSNWR